MTVIAKPRRRQLPCGHQAVTVHPHAADFHKWCPTCRTTWRVTVTEGHYGGWLVSIVLDPIVKNRRGGRP